MRTRLVEGIISHGHGGAISLTWQVSKLGFDSAMYEQMQRSGSGNIRSSISQQIILFGSRSYRDRIPKKSRVVIP